MKRTPFMVVVPIVIGGAFLLLLTALMSRVVMRPSAWREQVDYYLQANPGLSFVDAKRAQQPSQFREEMSERVYSRSGYHAVSVHKAVVNTPGPQLWQTAGVGQPPPLPYPPEDVWCVTLSQSGGGRTIIFVALHVADMYYSEWVTHEAAGDPNAIAAAIGCN